MPTATLSKLRLVVERLSRRCKVMLACAEGALLLPALSTAASLK